MKNILLFASILMVLFIAPIKSVAQEKSTQDSTVKESSLEKNSYGLVSANYNSNIVFLGRRSSSVAPYLSAYAGYYHKSGLFINGGASYLTAASENRIDLLMLSTGYHYYLNNFSAGISGTKYFFNSKSYTAKSALSGNVNAYADYDFDIVDVYVDGSIYFSNASDFVLSTVISHAFYAAKDNLDIIPAFSIYAGTQNYFGDYNNNRRFGRHMQDGVGSQSIGKGMMGAGSLIVLDYELSVPISYTIKKFWLSFTPVYAIPVNPATITNDLNNYKEDISNTLFWSLGVVY